MLPVARTRDDAHLLACALASKGWVLGQRPPFKFLEVENECVEYKAPCGLWYAANGVQKFFKAEVVVNHCAFHDACKCGVALFGVNDDGFTVGLHCVGHDCVGKTVAHSFTKQLCSPQQVECARSGVKIALAKVVSSAGYDTGKVVMIVVYALQPVSGCILIHKGEGLVVRHHSIVEHLTQGRAIDDVRNGVLERVAAVCDARKQLA